MDRPRTAPCRSLGGRRAGRRRLCALAALAVLCSRAALAQQILPETNPKHRIAQAVYDRLVCAIGRAQLAPIFQLQSSQAPVGRTVARLMPGQGGKVRIILEEEAYDVCAGFGERAPDALAFWLGHELAHYYREDGWAGEIGVASAAVDIPEGADTDTMSKIRSWAGRQKMLDTEAKADLFGGFYAHLAGYRTAEIASPVIESTYRAYGLREDLGGRYPKLAERQELAQRMAKELEQKFLPTFETGVRLLMLSRVLHRNYEAARCFDYIVREFPSREILNNAGVACALEAIELFEPEQLRFTYPLELDTDTWLRPRSQQYSWTRTITPPSKEGREALRSKKLADARTHFEKAKMADPCYATAVVNLASVFELLGKRELALGTAAEARETAEKTGEKVTAGSALIVRGIAHANLGDAAKAKAEFEAAAKTQPALARFNLRVLDPKAAGLPPSEQPRGELGASFKRETIAGLDDLNRSPFSQRPDVRPLTLQKLDDDRPEVRITISRSKDWEALLVETEASSAYVLATRPGYGGATARGLAIGSALADVQEKYGLASHLIVGRQGTYHLYRKTRIAFAVTAQDKVAGWMLYRAEEVDERKPLRR